MGRPTIRDLAEASGLSVATVNRVLAGGSSVRPGTAEQVFKAAETIGFYGVGSLKGRLATGRPRHRLGVLLLQSTRTFYRNLAQALQEAARAVTGAEVQLRVEYLDDLTPDHVAARMVEVGSECDALAVVTAEHPKVADAIEQLSRRNVPVFALISPLSAPCPVGYLGLDNWKVGRMSGWAFDNLSRNPGKIGILVGNHRYRCQEMNESGFRSYFREHGPGFTLLEPLSTFETASIAREMTETLLRDHPDLVGLFISGGGISGALAALRESGRAGEILAVGYELMDITKSALLDGTLKLVIAHPLKALAQATIETMIRAAQTGPEYGTPSIQLPFDLHTVENL